MLSIRKSLILSIASLLPTISHAQVLGGGGGACSPTEPLKYKGVEIGLELSQSAIIQGASVNESGFVTGTYSNGTKSNPFYWSGTRVSLLPTFAGNQGSGLGINNSSLIVGHSDAAGGVRRAFKVRPGQNLQALPLVIGGKSNQAHGVNASGIISGCSDGEIPSGQPWMPPLKGTFPVIWRTSGISILDSGATSFSQNSACAFDVNASGAASGYVVQNYSPVATYWNAQGSRTTIGTLPNSYYLGSEARGMNANNVVVGRSGAQDVIWLNLEYLNRAFKWSASEGIKLIQSPGQCITDICFGANASDAYDINKDNQIVGYFRIYGRDYASIYHPQYETSLYFDSIEPLVSNRAALGNPQFHRAVSVNDAGQILVNGVKSNGAARAYLLTRDCGAQLE